MKKPAKKSFTPDARGPLNGVRVVDLSRLVAGNILTLQLADFGAEVIKIEPPEGDTLRSWRVKGVETAWKVYSRNKKSVALDLRSDAGRAIVRELTKTAAILVESFRPGVLEDMGLVAGRAARDQSQAGHRAHLGLGPGRAATATSRASAP